MVHEIERKGWFAATVAVAFLALTATTLLSQEAVLKAPLTIYQQPDLSSGIVAKVQVGDTILVVARDGAWVEVKLAPGRYGWFPLGSKEQHGKGGSSRVERKVTDGDPPARQAPARQATMSASTAVSGRPPSASAMRAPADRGWHALRYSGFVLDVGTFEGNAAYLVRLARERSAQFSWQATLGHIVAPDASLFLLYGDIVYHPIHSGRLQPYLAAGFGIVNRVPKQIETAESITHPAANYGLGVQWSLTSRLALKAEFRQYSVFKNGSNVNRQGFTLGVVLGRLRR